MAHSDSAEILMEPSKLVLGKVIADLLEIDADSLDWNTSFILLGGDSILAIDFIVRCRDEGIVVDMKELLEAESLAALAEQIDRRNIGATNGVNGHTNGVNGNGNGVHGHANGLNRYGKPAVLNGRNDWNASVTAVVGRRLRFASMEIAHGEVASILSTLERIVARHSALRSKWSVSSLGHWMLTSSAPSATMGHRQFYFAESMGAENVNDAYEALTRALASVEAPPFGCLAMANHAIKGTRTIALAADANLVDSLSMRLVLRELEACAKGPHVEPSFDFQFSDWVAQGCYGRSVGPRHRRTSPRSLKYPLEEANVTRSKSTDDTGMSGLDGYAEGFLTFTLSHSTTEKLLASQTHASLRTSPVDIVNAALSRALWSHSQDPEAVLRIQSAYSIREEQGIPLESIGCYEVEVGFEALAPEPQESLIHAVRRTRDARAGHSYRDVLERRAGSTAAVYVDCTRLEKSQQDLSSRDWRFSDPILGHGARVVVEMVADQARVSVDLEGTSLDAERVADELESCLEQMANALINAPPTATLADFPLVQWPYSALDELAAELQTHKMSIDDVESIAPCSAVQESFFVSQAMNSASYVSHVSITLQSAAAQTAGGLAVERIVEAWEGTVKRHAMLRTTFVESKDRLGKSDQMVLEPLAMPPCVEVRPAPASGRPAVRPRPRPFQAPLRLCISEVSATELRLDLEISHALVDGHSARILLQDFRASYVHTAHFSAQPPLPYAVFASRQQRVAGSEEASAGAAYWTGYLNAATESRLPVLTSNPHLGQLEPARCSLPLPEGQLRAVCGRFAITPANLFHIAWALAIRRLTLSDSVTFSYIVSGRDSHVEGAEATVGPLLNTLPCALTLTPETSVADALSLAKRDWQNGLQFQNTPIAYLPTAKSQSLKLLGNTLLSIEREATNSHVLAKGISMTINERTSATDVRDMFLAYSVLHSQDNSLTYQPI
jgi:aryl carrier-like protein